MLGYNNMKEEEHNYAIYKVYLGDCSGLAVLIFI